MSMFDQSDHNIINQICQQFTSLYFDHQEIQNGSSNLNLTKGFCLNFLCVIKQVNGCQLIYHPLLFCFMIKFNINISKTFTIIPILDQALKITQFRISYISYLTKFVIFCKLCSKQYSSQIKKLKFLFEIPFNPKQYDMTPITRRTVFVLKIQSSFTKQQFKLLMPKGTTTSKQNQEIQQRLFETRLARIQKKNLKKMKMLEGKSVGRWQVSEQTKYYLFLLINEKLFEKKNMRKNDKVFKIMSNFIMSRTPDQCRSHHQKIQKKFPGIKQILQKLQKQFGGVNMKEILGDYNTLSLETLDSLICKNQNSQEYNQEQELPSRALNLLLPQTNKNLMVFQNQPKEIGEPYLVQFNVENPFFYEENVFGMMEF